MELLRQIPGPQFLLLYVLIACFALGLGRWLARRGSGGLFLSRDYQRADALSVACLRGGENEMLRIVILALLERKWAEIVEEEGSKRKVIRACADGEGSLAGLEEAVHRRLHDGSLATSELFADPRLIETVARFAAPLTVNLEREGLLAGAGERERARRLRLSILAPLLLFGGAKLWLGIVRHKPVAFLVILLVLTIVAAFLLIRPGRLSARGEHYLAGLREHYRWLRDETNGRSFNPALAVALFGVGVLSAHQAFAWLQQPYQDFFRQGGSSSGCGSSGCSSSGCSSGGCGGGGGCGGCGGGD